MKRFFKLLILPAMVALSLVGCDKKQDLSTYGNGTMPVLTSSTNTLAPVATDSLKKVLGLAWTNPKYASDSTTYKYVVEIDSAGRNFSKAYTHTVTGAKVDSFTAKELNTALLNWGFAFNTAYDVEIRVTSSYANNNEQLRSNVIRIKMTPYKVPPKVALPTTSRLFIVGDATTFGWTNDPTPAFPAARELVRLDETSWGGIFYMNGTGGYKFLQTQGVWSTQFHMMTGGTVNSGNFVQEDADPSFPSPTTAGWYKISLDFQTGKYTVTAYGNPLSQDLYITGDATTAGWVNNPPANQKFTRINSSVYQITMSFTPGKSYKFLGTSGSWAPQFGGSSATGSILGANYGSGTDPDAVPTPATAGTYKVNVNFFTNAYTVTQ